MTLPLEHVEVIDLGTLTPGKHAAFLLAEMAARVVRVERPGAAGTALSDEDRALNRGKRSLTLDLGRAEGREILARLVERADVLIEGYRPGVAARLGADWATLAAINPRLVYCSLSGFGHTGPDRGLTAYDLNLVGTSGLLAALYGRGARPRVPEAYLADAVSGLTAALAIALALYERERTGRGRHIDLAMLDSVFGLLAVSHGLLPGAATPSEPPPSPLYTTYETADGRYVTLAALRPASLRALASETGHPELETWAADGGGPAALTTALERIFRTASAADWISRLRPHGVEIGLVNRPDEAFAEPQLLARGLVEEVPLEEGAARPGVTTALRPTWDRGDRPARAAPRPGEDTEAILGELGFEPGRIEELRRSGAI